MTELSRTQINDLGDRLRAGPLTDPDRELLLEYRSSFLPAYQKVVGGIRAELGVDPTGRPEKTPESIMAKLRRSKTELARMQDIAGCRLVVSDIADQDRLVSNLIRVFSTAKVVDRRSNPSHGYRAVHVIPTLDGMQVEIQVRTAMQDLWAATSEYLADEFGNELKYGGTPPGSEAAVGVLAWSSSAMRLVEDNEGNATYVRPPGPLLRLFKLGQGAAIMQLALKRNELL